MAASRRATWISRLAIVLVLLLAQDHCLGQEPGSDAEQVPPEAGPPAEVPAVVFVIDCSGSMSRRTPMQQAQIDVTRDALKALLKKLPERSCQVGLILYGHRAGWEAGGFEKIRYNAATIDESIDRNSLHPSQDVEIVAPLALWNNESSSQAIARLDRAQPWGQSPLYLSIQKALEQLANVKGEVPRSIVVITDGDDDPGLGPRKLSALDLTNLRRNHPNARIDFITLGSDANRDLSRLAKAYGGKILTAEQPHLVGNLLSQLVPIPPAK